MSIPYNPTPMTQFKVPESAGAEAQVPRAGGNDVNPESGGSGIPSQQSLFESLEPKKKKEITILLVGQTGSGKTAFLSLFLNLLEGNGPLQLVDKHDAGAESGRRQSQSQTTKATLYTFTTSTGVKFRILDTPGLADTQGLETDDAHRYAIHQAIVDYIESIDAILVVANGGVTRLDASTNYTLHTISSLFPQSIINNIGFIFTHTTDKMGLNFPISDLGPELHQAAHSKFLFENPLVLHKAFVEESALVSTSPRDLAKMKRRLEAAYDNSMDSLDELLEWLNKTNPHPTNEIIRLYELSISIEGRLQATLGALQNATSLCDEIAGLKRRSEQVGERKASIEESLNKKPRKVWVLKVNDVKNTICITNGCHSNCHLKCTLSYTESLMLGRWCSVFYTWGVPHALRWGDDDEVLCSKCQHPAKYHRNYNSLHQEVDAEQYLKIREALELETRTQDGLELTQKIIQEELDKATADIEEAKAQIQKLVSELNEISLTRSFAGRIRSGIQLLEVQRRGLESSSGSAIELRVVDEALTLLKKQLELIENRTGTYAV
ncbi:unnamed protein product [Rhizoctonia solani]|uniref:AIG1-type G domain-containing protein n=1 Tax=Rhizoctonia solani TaxID=456999 RepID=A0A8H3HB41_9AGAM|nr:unnamed protein product [Rhizoctonia solani]